MTEEVVKDVSEDHEDGEITDDDDEGPIELPVHSETLPIEYPSSDEETPEEVLRKFAKKAEERKDEEEVVQIDPKLCGVCKKNEHKYRCPRCNLRSCSLDCSKLHKTENNCDGVRQPFTNVAKLSQYDGEKSIDDQKFIHSVKEKVGLGAENTTNSTEIVASPGGDGEPENPDALRYTTNSGTERYLINAARFRHIRLGFSAAGEGESRHEQFSDTIFWTVKITFKKEKLDGSVDTFEKIVHNIPETIRFVTVLKQFFKPRKFGCIVSESDLDLEKMEPFIEKGYDNVNVFMEVHGNPDKFYGVSGESTILENTRNRVISDYPKFIITLDDEFVNMQLLSQEEMEQIATKYGGISHGGERFGGGGGRGGRGRGGGFHRGGGGGGRGGGNGGGNNFQQRKRPAQGGFEGGNNWKKPRGGGGRGRHFNNRSHQNVDSFDPFEPFSGPSRLPMEYGTAENKN